MELYKWKESLFFLLLFYSSCFRCSLSKPEIGRQRDDFLRRKKRRRISPMRKKIGGNGENHSQMEKKPFFSFVFFSKGERKMKPLREKSTLADWTTCVRRFVFLPFILYPSEQTENAKKRKGLLLGAKKREALLQYTSSLQASSLLRLKLFDWHYCCTYLSFLPFLEHIERSCFLCVKRSLLLRKKSSAHFLMSAQEKRKLFSQ